MFLVKQFNHRNMREARNFGTILHQINDISRNVPKTSGANSCVNTKFTAHSGTSRIELLLCSSKLIIDSIALLMLGCGVNALKLKTPNLVIIRHHYRNYNYHPSRIVRAYRMTRTWLTDHFVIAEKRFENIYSFLMLLTTAILFIVITMLNLQVGGEAGGLDVDHLNKDDKKK